MVKQKRFGRVSLVWVLCLLGLLIIGCSGNAGSSSSTSSIPDADLNAVPKASNQQTDDGSGYLSFESLPNKVSLHWQDSEGEAYGQLEDLRRALEQQGKVVLMLTNAGIYSPGQIPAGLHVEQGNELRSINLLDGEGNFQLLPNGVFYIDGDSAGVMESNKYAASGIQPRLAVQSGPQLLLDGDIHPEFNETSNNRFVRNGVGILPNGNVIFLMSRRPVTFWDFASEFQRRGVENALYLDGNISAMDFPADGKNLAPTIAAFAGMLVVVE